MAVSRRPGVSPSTCARRGKPSGVVAEKDVTRGRELRVLVAPTVLAVAANLAVHRSRRASSPPVYSPGNACGIAASIPHAADGGVGAIAPLT